VTPARLAAPVAHREQVPAGTWWGLYPLLAVGLGLRVAVGFASESIYHPDEVFQYLEQAHRLVFRYGVIPWEFRFGARSWLLALFISWPLHAARVLGLDDPTFYVPLVKLVFCLVSLSLIVSAYRIGRNLVSESAGRLAAVLTSFWYELLYFAPRSLTDIVATYFLLFALACATERAEQLRAIFFGMSVAVGIALRMQYLPLAGLLLVLVVRNWPWRAVGRAIVALLGALMLAGYLDYLTWGHWFASYYNNYLFNVARGLAKTLGRMRDDWYLWRLALTSAGLFPLVIVLSVGFLRRLWVLLAWVVIVVGVHSLVPLKDHRFIFAAIPILLVMTAAVTVLLATRVMPGRPLRAAWATTGLMALIALAGMLGQLPRDSGVYPRWPLYRQDVLRAFEYLREDAHLAGVLLNDVPWWRTGGYYYLHRNVPLYLRTHAEAMRRENAAGIRAYVSHIVCPVSTTPTEGYTPVARFGALEVRKQLAPAGAYSDLASYTPDMPQRGIDGVYVPSVRPHVRLFPRASVRPSSRSRGRDAASLRA
jgi:hypothetical protein